ncbi:MAG: response regulator [bacterium]
MIDIIANIIASPICISAIIIPIGLCILFIVLIIKKFSTFKNPVILTLVSPSSINGPNYQDKSKAVNVTSKRNLIKIFVIEDEIEAFNLFVDILSSGGFEVAGSTDPREALDKLSISSFDLILCGIVMPYVNGVQLLQKITAEPNKYHFRKFAFLTNIDGELAVKKAFELGADGYIIKSDTDPEKLIKCVYVLLNSNSQIDFSKYEFKQENDVISVTDHTPSFNYNDQFNPWKYVLPRNNFSTEQKYWIEKLQIPYKRSALGTVQCEDEIIKLYSNIAIFTDSYLKNKKSSLDKLIIDLNRSNGYYSNILYTFECVAEGEVEKHYKGRLGYDNEFSYQLLINHIGKDYVTSLKEYLAKIINQIGSATQDTILKLGLAANGLPFLSWDPEGTIRNKYNLSDDERYLLDYTHVRSNKFLEITQCRLETTMLYVSLIRAIQADENTNLGFKVVLEKIIKREWVHYQLTPLYKICENEVRKAYSATQLDLKKEYHQIAKRDGKEPTDALFAKITNLSSKIVKANDETVKQLILLNPKNWKVEFSNLLSNINTENYLEKFNESKALLMNYKTTTVLSDIYFYLGKIFTPLNQIISLYFFYEYNSQARQHQILNPTITPKKIPLACKKILFNKQNQEQKFNLINNNLNTYKGDILSQLKEVYMVQRKTVTINETKIMEITKVHQNTANKLGEFIDDFEDTESSKEVTIKEISLITTPYNSKSDVFTSDQINLLRKIQSNNYKISKIDLQTIARSCNQFPNTLVSNINQIYYNKYEDSLIIESKEQYFIEEYNISIIKEYL